MSPLTPHPKFLLDENVRAELARFLKEKGFQVKVAPKGVSDRLLADLSKKEKLIFVTNDTDFAGYTSDKIHSVVLLGIPQNDPNSLQDSFAKLLVESKDFKGKRILLESSGWNASALAKKVAA